MTRTAPSLATKTTAITLVGLLAFIAPTVDGSSHDDRWVPVRCVGHYESGAYDQIFNEYIGDTANPYIALLWDTINGGGGGGGQGPPRLTSHPCSGLDVVDAFGASVVPFVQGDENNNGMGDVWEELYSVVSTASGHLDFDDLTNLQEFQWLTNPLDEDSDDDGWSDSEEAAYWGTYSKAVKGGTGPGFAYTGMGAFLDTDGDLIPNIWDEDSDNDGLLDGEEIYIYGTMPELQDTDGDGLIDGGITLNGERIPGEVYDSDTDPNNPDSDGDGLNDQEEYQYWSQAGNARTLDTDGDGVPNAWDKDSDNDFLWDGAEVHTWGSQPGEWDTDGDDLPDGWETEYGLNPLNPEDAGLDSDSDSYNPDGAATPTLPWTNHDEYHYNIPLGWNVHASGVWWDGTDPNNPDTDSDQVLDGVEIHMGTNPRDGLDRDPRGVGANGDGTAAVARADPTNQNLPKNQMDPINLQYLSENRVDAAEEMNETAEVVDELISAAIAGNVTQALAAVYEVIPVDPPVRNAEETIAMTQDALVALVKCIDGTTDDVMALVADLQSAATDTTQCVSGVLLPFLDALLERTLEDLPLVNDLIAQVQQEVLPGVVGTATALAPLDLQATQQALLTDPVAALQETTLGVVDFASDPSNLQQAVADARAATQLTLADLLRPTSLHPQFTYDTFTKSGLAAQWPLVQAADDAAAAATLGQVHPVAAADSLVYNLYTKRGTDERVTGVPVGDRTCIQLSDTDTSTRDASGCDLYATLTFTEHGAEQVDRLPSSGQRLSPSLVLETAKAGASFALEAFAYLQLPDAPYIVVMGYATTDPAQGHPAKWTGTLLDYDVLDQTADRSISFASSYDDPRTRIPLHVVGGAFQVEVNEPNKPAVPGEETVLEIESAGFPDSVSFDARRSHLPIVEERNAEIAAQLSAPATLEVLHRDYYADTEAVLRLAATDLPAGNNRARQVNHGTRDLAWTWTSSGTTGDLDVGLRESVDGTTVRVQDFSGTGVPTSIRISGDTLTHLHSYEASAAPAAFQYLAGIGTDQCPGLTSTHTRYFTLESGPTLCVTANLGGTTSLQVQELDNEARLSMDRATSHAGNTGVLIRDGNDFFAEVSPTPTAWDASFTSLPGNVRTLDWTTTTPTNSGTFDVMLTESNERMVVDMTSVPASVDASFNAATGRGDLTASDHIGSLEWIVTNTGNAPTAASLNDYVRLLDVPDGVESAWRIQDAREVVARVTEDGAWEATGDLASPRNLEVYYEDETHQVLLTAAGVTGDFVFRTSEDAEAGTFHYDHAAAAAFGSVRLDGILPTGNVLIDVASAPATAVLDAALNAQRVTFTASSPASSLEAIYAPGGSHPDPGKSDAVVVTGTQTPTPGLFLDTRSTSLLDVTRVPGRIDIRGGYASGVPLDLRFDQSTDADHATISQVPNTATLTHAPGLLSWTSSTTGTDVSLEARGAGSGAFLEATAQGVPRNLEASWSTRAIDTFQSSVTHDGTPMGLLEIRDRRSIPGASGDATDAGWTFAATTVPQNLDVQFAPIDGRLTATATPTPAGLVEAGFGERTGYTLHAGNTGDAVVFLDEASGGIAGALRASTLSVLDVRLFRDGNRLDAAGSVHMERTTPATLYVKADSASRDAHAVVHHVNAPSDLVVALWPGAVGAEGFRFDLTGSSTGGGFEAILEREGRFLGAATPGASPLTLASSWQPGAPVRLDASGPTNVELQSVPSGVTPPSHAVGDFAAALKETGDADARFAARLTGVQHLLLDTEAHRFEVSGTGNSLLVDHVAPLDHNVIQLSAAPSDLNLWWDRAARSFTLDTVGSPGDLLLSAYPREEAGQAGQRILVDLAGAPGGRTTFQADPNNAFRLDSPSVIGEAVVTVDFDIGPAGRLAGDGVHLQASQEAPAVFLRLPGIRDAELTLPATGQPVLRLDRGFSASTAPAAFRLPTQGATRLLELDALPGGTSTYTWPSTTVMQFAATGTSARDLRIASDAGSDRSELRLTDAAGSWSLGFQETGNLDYTANTRAGILDAFASWHGAAYDLDIQGVPTEFDLSTLNGLDSGTLTATNADRTSLALTTASGSGQMPRVPSNGRDLLALDTTTAGGMLSLNLAGLEDLTWDVPDGAGAALAHDLVASIDLSAATTTPALVQLVHPDHQTRATLDRGIPASFEVRLGRNMASWTLGADVYLRDLVFQHQTDEAGAIRVEIDDGPLNGVLRVEPKALRPLDYSASTGAGGLRFASAWNAGFVEVDLSGIPTRVRVQADDALLTGGVVGSLGTGSVSQAEILVIPDTSSTANRVDPRRHHLAVETQGKAPYLSLNLESLQEASWRLPDPASRGDVFAELDRSVSHGGTTWIVLNGPREDVTIEADDAAADLRWTLTPSTNTAGAVPAQPLSWTLESLGAATGEVRFTHLHAETMQMATALLRNILGRTDFVATGTEPSWMDLTTGGLSEIQFSTLDGGTALQFDVINPTPRLTATVTRGTCDVTAPFQGRVTTHGTGNTGPTHIFIGDGGRVPAMEEGRQAVDARCRGGEATIGLQLATVQDTHWDTTTCGGSHRFGANQEPTEYFVETEQGFLKALAALQSTGNGWVGIEFANGAGVNLDASGKLSILEKEVTFPTCMEFISPVNWYRLKATSVPADLHLNVNPQSGGGAPGGLGNGAFSTIEMESPMGATLGSLEMDIRLDKVGRSRFHESQIIINSPVWSFDVHLGDDNFNIYRGLNADGLEGTITGEFDYHIHFENVNHFRGNANHECGKNEFFRFDYERIPGSSPRVLDGRLDMGPDCGLSRIRMQSLPSTLQYGIDLVNLFDAKLEIYGSSQRISSLALWTQQICQTDLLPWCGPQFGGLVHLRAEFSDIPAGPRVFKQLIRGASGLLQLQPVGAGGPVGHMDIGLSAGQSDYYISFGMADVQGKIEWDLDGDSSYSEMPRFVYWDTDGGWINGAVRLRFGNVGFGAAIGSPIEFQAFQFRFGMKDFGLIDLPWAKFNGKAVSTSQPMIKLEGCVMGKWFKIPLPEEIFL